MRVLVACEFSGTVRDAFRARGHDAWSCDLLPCEADPRFHIQGDVTALLERERERESNWDLMIAHPPCTFLTVAGARWMYDPRFPTRAADTEDAVRFFMTFVRSTIPKVAIENPIGIMSTRYRKPDQIIQPWQFGHPETKATCLWLKGLPVLKHTNLVEGREARVHRCAPGPERWKIRSRTYPGIARAMAEQWGD